MQVETIYTVQAVARMCLPVKLSDVMHIKCKLNNMGVGEGEINEGNSILITM